MATTLESTILRTFYQTGLAFDVVEGIPAMINVSIDGKPIYNGSVPGISEPYAGYTGQYGPMLQNLFTWPVDIDFMGPVIMSIEVTDCTLLLTSTKANYMDISGDHAAIGNLDYLQEVDGVSCQDPFTDVKLNGVPMQRGIMPPSAPLLPGEEAPLTGQWAWAIGPDCVFETTLHINPGWF
jgi:hypothetical protein